MKNTQEENEMAFNNVENFLESECPYNYNFEFECDIKEYTKLSPIARYITYTATTADALKSAYPMGRKFAETIHDTYSDLADCDGSQNDGNNQLIRDIYKKLWGWNKDNDTFGSLRLEKFSCRFGGETMNSMKYPLNDIAADSVYNDSALKKRGFLSANHLINLFAQDELRPKLIYVLENVDGLVEYINSYHTLGNFTLVPAGFNGFRGFSAAYNGAKINDYWDLSLRLLQDEGYSDTFSPDDFVRYVNLFFLWDYIDENSKPKSLKDDKDKTKFYTLCTEYIKRRGIFMTAMLKLQAVIGEEYNIIVESVFSEPSHIYRGYDEVLELIKVKLRESINTFEANKILDDCKDLINRG